MDTLPLVTLFVAFFSSILSGIAGGGGGFIVAPYWLLIGLSPAQGAATGAFMALGMSGGSLAAFRGAALNHLPRRVLGVLLAITFVVSCVGPFFLNEIDVAVFAPILAVVTLCSLPFLFIRPSLALESRAARVTGFIALVLLLFASSFITSSAFSILISAVLLQVFKLGVLEGTAVRRMLGVVQSLVLFALLALLGNFVWAHGVMGILGGITGSYIGTRIALHRGERFARWMLVAGGALTATGLIFI